MYTIVAWCGTIDGKTVVIGKISRGERRETQSTRNEIESESVRVKRYMYFIIYIKSVAFVIRSTNKSLKGYWYRMIERLVQFSRVKT